MSQKKYPLEFFYNIGAEPLILNFNYQTIDLYLNEWKWISDLKYKKSDGETYNTQYHWHPELEISYVYDGNNSMYFVDGQLNTCEEETVIVINPNQVHGFKNVVFKEQTQILTIVFPMEFLNRFYPEAFSRKFEIPVVEKMNSNQKTSYQELLRIFKQIMNIKDRENLEKNKYNFQLIYTAYVLEILGLLVIDFSKKKVQNLEEKKQKENFLLQKALSYIHHNYYEKISLVDIANEVNISVSYLCKLFKETSGHTVYQYLERIRSMHAMDDLKKTQKTITEIAIDNGFVDTKALNRVLKRNYNMSAKEIVLLEWEKIRRI